MTAMHTDSERDYLLRLAGVRDADVAALTPSSLIDEVTEEVILDVPPGSADPAEAQPLDLLVQAILSKSRGDKDTALRMVDAHVKAEFDARKLSKFNAAKLGLDLAGKAEHNRAAWASCQKLGESMKTHVRRHFRENGGFVSAKITAGRHKLDL